CNRSCRFAKPESIICTASGLARFIHDSVTANCSNLFCNAHPEPPALNPDVQKPFNLVGVVAARL
ncbi:MAG TPA: hypothetical protein VJN01_14450, partial [Xanthomonadales bacterium]|nr:hypothetical protein [Xanthomonadales bacterium]